MLHLNCHDRLTSDSSCLKKVTSHYISAAKPMHYKTYERERNDQIIISLQHVLFNSLLEILLFIYLFISSFLLFEFDDVK